MATTGFFSHPDCLRHEMGAGHPECPERLSAIHDRLLITGLADVLDRREAPEAPLADLELAHGRMHVAALRGLSDELRDEIAAAGPTHAQIDPDTALNVHTWSAALRAAGAAIAATDAVMAGELENAFCAVRPPGHHACRDQAMGFCFFNNVAVAARYALDRHGLQRVAVIDFDVHHGNGTEDILRGDPRVLMASFFSTRSTPTAAPRAWPTTCSMCRCPPTPAAARSAKSSTRCGCRGWRPSAPRWCSSRRASMRTARMIWASWA